MTAAPQLDANTAPVPGAHGYDLAAPVTAADILWTPEDGEPFACPIGTALAAEMSAAGESS